MGIAVPDLTIDSTGVLLANAYLAISKNTVYLQPQQNGTNTIYTSYNVWNSVEDRLAGKQAVESRPLQISAPSFDGMYDLLYIALKERYPGSVDVVDAASVPTIATQPEVAQVQQVSHFEHVNLLPQDS
jgi:hypothetical protein